MHSIFVFEDQLYAMVVGTVAFQDLDLAPWTFCSSDDRLCEFYLVYYNYVSHENVIPSCSLACLATRMCISSFEGMLMEKSCFTFISSGCLGISWCIVAPYLKG